MPPGEDFQSQQAAPFPAAKSERLKGSQYILSREEYLCLEWERTVMRAWLGEGQLKSVGQGLYLRAQQAEDSVQAVRRVYESNAQIARGPGQIELCEQFGPRCPVWPDNVVYHATHADQAILKSGMIRRNPSNHRKEGRIAPGEDKVLLGHTVKARFRHIPNAHPYPDEFENSI